jgi:hypothetical protein
MEQKQFKELMQEVSALVHLQTADLVKDRTLRESIQILNRAGLGPARIAKILGKKSSYVNKELSSIRKKGK